MAPHAVTALSSTILMFDSFHDVEAKMKAGNAHAKKLMESWAKAEWFTNKPELPKEIKMVVFKVDGETNTDDLSPAQDAWSRPDIPLHAKAMLINKMPDGLKTIETLKQKGLPLAYVGDVVGTGSSRKSAINSVQWFMGDDIPNIPNKRTGGVVIGGKIAPIFFNTAEDSGAFPIQADVSKLSTGDVITIKPYEGKIFNEAGAVVATFELSPVTMPDEVRAGGRIPLIIGRGLTTNACKALGLPAPSLFITATPAKDSGKGFTLAQKMVGRACGLPEGTGVRPGAYCEPKATTVGSQDTTGGMTRDELKELACLGFSSDLVMQSFCHTAAYPKPVDIKLQHTLPEFMSSRGGVSLRPGDGVIHSWLNRMILPDTVGTGGDSHTRFPIGISFPAGSGLVAFAAATGAMPLDMPESVLVRFKGEMQAGITLRDLVNAIPYAAIQEGTLTVGKTGKKNVFNGRILEIEGLPDLKVEQAFEFADASAERSANGCTVLLNEAPVIEFLNSNIVLMQNMIENGYEDARTLQRRIENMQAWLKKPELMKPDADAEYAHVIEIDLNQIKEPLVACPNDPDDIKPLSAVVGDKIDEVFIGSCMTNIGHYRAAAKVLDGMGNIPTRLWIAPPTRMDEAQLRDEGVYSVFGVAGARTEVPGCSLCMGNQARVADKATVFSTSTRNFDNRMGKDARVYLGSAELAAVCAKLGRMPTHEEYLETVGNKLADTANIYKYLNFNQMTEYKAALDTLSSGKKVIPIAEINEVEEEEV
jgi:aconitate hydratase 2/2-methylisocitrate dehydratase